MSETKVAPPKRHCHGLKKDGAPCASTIVDVNGYCVVHGASSCLDAAERGRLGGKRSGEARRELARTVRERLREKVEAEAELIWQAYRGALTATMPDGSPDARARYQAASSVLAEAYGKPLQPTEEKGGGLIFVHPLLGRTPIGELPADGSVADIGAARARKTPPPPG